MDDFRGFADALMPDIEDWIQRILISAGRDLMKRQVAILEMHNKKYTGELIDSIGYAVRDGAQYHGHTRWELDLPVSDHVLVVGTAAPYATYIKHGMHGYNGGESGREGGTRRILKWAQDHGFSEHNAKYLVHKIMAEGVAAPSIDFTPSAEEMINAVKNARRREPLKVRKIKTRSFVVEVHI